MQQQSHDVMKANSKSAEEKNMVITCRISSFWNEFLQQEYNDKESKEKQTKNQHYCPNFVDRLKRFYLSTKNTSNKKFANLPIRTIFAETSTNVQAEECLKKRSIPQDSMKI